MWMLTMTLFSSSSSPSDEDDDVCRIAKEDYEFYQMLLSNTATACQPSSILTLFPDGEVSPNLRITPAIDTVKAVFKHLEDAEGCREFFATTFENLQVALQFAAVCFD